MLEPLRSGIGGACEAPKVEKTSTTFHHIGVSAKFAMYVLTFLNNKKLYNVPTVHKYDIQFCRLTGTA